MARFDRGAVSIHYEERGSGFPLLLLAPGGLDSTIEAWTKAAIDPFPSYADEFHLIAMDQRNAGQSTGPFALADPWGSYADDQLALMDHLGIDRFLVMGCCIGCSYALKLAERAPARVRAAVLEQPIGLMDDNTDHWLSRRQNWVAKLVSGRTDLEEQTGDAFTATMLAVDGFVGSVTEGFVGSCQTPLAVLPGNDEPHPAAVGRRVGELAPNATLIDPWKDTPEHLAEASQRVLTFLRAEATR